MPTPSELTYFPVTGFFNFADGGSLETFDTTVVFTPRVPAGFTALVSDLDLGNDTSGSSALAWPPVIVSTNSGVLSLSLLSNSAPVAAALAAAGITQLWYDVQFTKVTLGYQIQNFSFPAPTDGTAVCLTDPGLERYQFGGTIPTVSLPAGMTAFGVELIGAANEAAAQALLGISPTADYLGVVSSQSAMLALSSALVGEFCYRSDVGSFYYLIATPPSTLANWAVPETLPPIVNNADGTLSVNSINALEPLSTVTILTASTSPAIGQTTYYNATSGNLTPVLPALSGLRVGARLAVRRDPADSSSNTVTLSCAGSDTFYSSGSASATLPISGEQREYQVISISGTKYWAPQGSLTPVSKLVPWSAGTAGVLPATSGQHLTTQGGNTLDDGSGHVAIIGGTLDGVTIGATTPSPSINATTIVVNHNVTLSGTEKPWLTQSGAVSGSLTGGGHINKLFMNDAVAQTDNSWLYGLRVNQNIFTPAVGLRNAVYGQIQVTSAGTNTQTQAQYVGVQGRVSANTGLGGTGMGAGQPIGAYWGGWFAAGVSSGTYHGAIIGNEIDLYAAAGTSVFTKVGVGVTLVGTDVVRGTVNDAGMEIARSGGVTNTFKTGIQFGDQQGSVLSTPATLANWAFASDSTLIGTSTAYGSEVLPAGIGIDFSNVTFTTAAIKLPAASIAMAEMGSAPSAITGDGQIYVASDGSLHFLSPGGTDTQLAPA